MIQYVPYLENWKYGTHTEELDRIAKLCDGKRNLNSIYIAWGKQNPERGVREIKESMDRALHEFQNCNLLLWKNDKNPFQKDFTELHAITYRDRFMAIFMEKYISDLLDFLASFNLPCEEDNIICQERDFIFTAANISPLLFNKLFIRLKTFEYSLNFFLLLDERKNIVGVVSVMVENVSSKTDIPKISVGTIDLVAVKNWRENQDYFAKLLNFVEHNIHKVTCLPLTKLRFIVNEELLEEEKEFISLLSLCGYKQEHTFEKECGNYNITFLSKFLTFEQNVLGE